MTHARYLAAQHASVEARLRADEAKRQAANDHRFLVTYEVGGHTQQAITYNDTPAWRAQWKIPATAVSVPYATNDPVRDFAAAAARDAARGPANSSSSILISGGCHERPFIALPRHMRFHGHPAVIAEASKVGNERRYDGEWARPPGYAYGAAASRARADVFS